MIQQKNNRQTLISLALVALMLAVVLVLDQVIQPTDYMSMLLKVLQKASVYALAAVSLNLLTGFTGLFSLGHAGFMLIGTYIFTPSLPSPLTAGTRCTSTMTRRFASPSRRR